MGSKRQDNELDETQEKMLRRTFFLLPRQIRELKRISDVETKQSHHVRKALDRYLTDLSKEGT